MEDVEVTVLFEDGLSVKDVELLSLVLDVVSGFVVVVPVCFVAAIHVNLAVGEADFIFVVDADCVAIEEGFYFFEDGVVASLVGAEIMDVISLS